MKIQNQKVLESKTNIVNYKYSFLKYNFSKIPGSPIAYWTNENLIKAFKDGKELSSFAEPKVGLQTGDNNRFLKYWYEVNNLNIGYGLKSRELAKSSAFKWFPANKGGKFRKWYGNNEYIVNWENDGYEICNFKNNNGKLRSRPQNLDTYFKKGISWTVISSNNSSFRYSPEGFVYTNKGPSILSNDDEIDFFILGILNSKVSNFILNIISPTIGFEAGYIAKIPILINDESKKRIIDLVKENIKISKMDWDIFETSWDFTEHPLILFKDNNRNNIKSSFINWEKYSLNQFNRIKKNEELINQILIELYGLKAEISSEFNDKEITYNKANLSRDIIIFISYAVGCMLGRYSLDEEGLIYAGGQWDPSKYCKFLPDDDNIIPILDTEYFEDDIVGRFVEFVKVTFGEETLEENLDFIAKTLKKKGTTSREVIRNYFLTDFYKDHVKTYKKHPIYWLFDSGRNNGFKALIYIHGYEGDLVARVRTDYLHKTQKALETAITHNDRIIETSISASEKSKAVKDKNKLVKQLEETKKYDEALAHVANQKIEIDLDDGVKVNYAKFQGVEVSSEGQKTKKIDLLKKI
jgi:type II restriction/modification system DNA methylase subunit YeeA